jgi:Histidine kinase-like ATPase domain
VLDRAGLRIPHLAPVCLTTVGFSAFVGELAPGLVSAGPTMAYVGAQLLGLTAHPLRFSPFELEDFGRPFDPERYVAPEPGILQESGWGLYLMRFLADRVSFDVAWERGTRWTLVKYRAGWSMGDGRATDPVRPG